ncbi:MAG TPA: DNA phosphorothioation system sulfurtransferase DndC [Mucilaginibacter sp.]|nr:DNA phosphorothioation system sulfurtransferase DndC [Mucilaginibacter sp.]
MSLNIHHLENEIIDQYLYDENSTRPWIIGFSGGKDSTMLLQVVWKALQKIDPILLTRQIYVVCNDTLVENPRIVKFIEATLLRIQQAAAEQQLPIIVQQTVPKLEDTFWVKLIGLGYPAPNKVHRWCTDRLKIDPTTRFILEKVDEDGQAIILLGTRSAESSKRADQIKRNEVKGQRLRKHVLRNAYVYAPIKDVITSELWQYLNLNDPPWGGSHKELQTLYRNANSGDCPLVIDDTTPSCGNSRFGCWVCTVVNKDKSMEGLIDNGEDWMEPLVEIRNFLVEARDNPEVYREKKRRNGTIDDDKWGPYSFHTRAEILRRIFEAQKEIQAVEPIELITQQEMVLIQYYWFRDLFFTQRVSDIYNEVFNRNLHMGKHKKNFQQEQDLLKASCQQESKDVELIQDLLALQKTKTLMIRKRGLQADLENRIEQFIEELK